MKDHIMTDMQEFQKKQRARVEAMSDEELAMFTSRSMVRAEIGMDVAAQRLCTEAGSDRLGKYARAMCEVLSALGLVKSAHATLSMVQADIIDAPIATRNER